MPANTAPIFSLLPEIASDGGTAQSVSITVATNTYDGVSTDGKLVFTAGANGSYIKKLRIKSLGTNTVAALRIFLNNGATRATATNNKFYGEVSLPAVTASSTSGTVDIDYVMDIALPPAWAIYACVSAGITAGWTVCAVAGDY